MTSKLQALVQALEQQLAHDQFWLTHISRVAGRDGLHSLHLAIFQEPFLTWVMDGSKRAESRFSQTRVAPYQSVSEGDVLVLKKVAGPVVGVAFVDHAQDYRLDAKTWQLLRNTFAEQLRATDDSFWESRGAARFATVMFLSHCRELQPIDFEKSDRRGWVVLSSPEQQRELDL